MNIWPISLASGVNINQKEDMCTALQEAAVSQEKQVHTQASMEN